jgi:hypothetical protein
MGIFARTGDQIQNYMLKLSTDDRAFGMATAATGIAFLLLGLQISIKKNGE